jgi:serine/threonine protein kinase
MTAERWEQIAEVYHSARELKRDERWAFLAKMCAGDDCLRREVESLLSADAEAGDFIAEPIVKNAASVFNVEAESSLEGKNLAHYQILSRIGAGGMGEVYLAEDLKLGRLVALKILPEEFCGDPDILQRFRIEARAAATLNHPCIATLYSVEESGGCYFITLEYVAGENLADVISASETDLETALDLFICLADALAHSHEQGIVHRDIKPGNVMIKTDGVPKILDFGLAQIDRAKDVHFASDLKLTRDGQIFGTPSYMSPEQAEGKEVDHRSDVFSFGVLMYETITGTRPFKGDSYASIVSELLKTEPPSVAKLKPETPVALARLIERCLHKSRRKRPQSMREICAVLEETKAAIEAGVLRDSSAKLLSPEPKKVSLRWIFAPLVLLVAIAAFAVYYLTRQSPPPVISFDNMTLRKLSQTTTSGSRTSRPTENPSFIIRLKKMTVALFGFGASKKKTRCNSSRRSPFYFGAVLAPRLTGRRFSTSPPNRTRGTERFTGFPRSAARRANWLTRRTMSARCQPTAIAFCLCAMASAGRLFRQKLRTAATSV